MMWGVGLLTSVDDVNRETRTAAGWPDDVELSCQDFTSRASSTQDDVTLSTLSTVA